MIKKYIIGVIGETLISSHKVFHTEAESMEKAWSHLYENTPEGQKYKMESFKVYDETKDGEFLNNQFLQ